MNGFASGRLPGPSLLKGQHGLRPWVVLVMACGLGAAVIQTAVVKGEEAYGVYSAADGAPVMAELPPVVTRDAAGTSFADLGLPSAEAASKDASLIGAAPAATTVSYQEFAPLHGSSNPAVPACCPDANPSCGCPGWSAGIDYLNWKLRRRGLDFAVLEDGTATTLGSGRIQNLEFSRDSGVRASLGYQFDTLWQLRFGYTWFDAEDVDSAVRPPGTGQLFATRSHPVNNEEADTANAFGSFDLQVFDLEAARWLVLDNVSSLKLFAGLRFADIEENLIFDYDGRDFTNGRIENPVNLNGFGVRSGLEGRWDLFERLSLFGRAAASVMFANITSRLTETDFAGAVVIADEIDEYEQALPVLEAMLGAAYHWEGFELAGGYELSNWFNLGERAMFNDAANEGNYGPFSTDLLLEGFVLQFVVKR